MLTYALLLALPWSLSWTLASPNASAVLPDFNGIVVYASDGLLAGALILWLASHVVEPSRSLDFGPLGVSVPLAGLVALSALSVLWAPSSLVAAGAAIRLFGTALLYLLILNELPNQRLAGWVLVAGMVLQSVLAVAQFVRQADLGLVSLGEVVADVDVAGLWIRGSGLTRHPNILGGYILAGLWATLALSGRARHRSLIAMAFALGTAGLASTFSRSAWLAMAIGLSVAALRLIHRRTVGTEDAAGYGRLVAVGSLILLGFVVLWPRMYVTRLVVPAASRLGVAEVPADHTELTNLDMRSGYVAVARQLIAANTVTGVGAGNFSLAAQRLEPHLGPGHAYLPVHNVPLLIASELGVYGAALWMALLVTVLIESMRRWSALEQHPWFFAWSMCILGLFVISGFDFYTWGWQYGRLLFFATLGLWAASMPQPPLRC